MKAITHTPGPWVYSDGDIVARGTVVALVMGVDDFPCIEEGMEEEFKANVALITAAPDLLAALDIARIFAPHNHDFPGDITKGCPKCDAESAVAKAKTNGWLRVGQR